ncbi:MAG: SAM-dependent methyltransferase [Clostridia bacterium]|jgi:23S rRNA (cytosine1962-C5)-methyltransferase|nr:SAM-dependent methyltransferase [Clostridia bacterium]
MKTADDWKEYKILATANGMKKENWNGVVLLRPDPQVIWQGADLDTSDVNAVYRRSDRGGGYWDVKKQFPPEWVIAYKDLRFKVKPMGFKHTGLFPEQAVNWDAMRSLIENAKKRDPEREIKILNLFAYTGGASVACAKSGALVTHVDAARGMVERAGENARLSGIEGGIRYIVDDCMKFVAREQRRGNRYDAVIMDPPSYGRGPNGEMWKIEDNLYKIVEICTKLLKEKPLFFLINSYTTGLQPEALKNILKLTLKDFDGEVEAYEVGIPTAEGINLPCGASGMFLGR